MNPFWQYFIAPPSTFHSNSELSPSGLSHEPLELDPDPEDPSLKAAKDEALQRWLLEWKQDKYSEAFVGLRSKDRLLKCLQSTKLPPLELLSISRAIVFHSSNDWVISAFACAAEKKGRNTAIGMECIKRQYWAGLELAKPAMWRLIDRGDHSFLDQLYMMNVDLTNEIPDQDPYFSNLKIHGFVGAAECLWLKGKNEKALDMLGALNLRKLTPEEERANSWIHGLIYLALKRYSDAAPQFKQVATARPYAYTEEATRWYAVCLAQQRKWTLAESAFDSWVRRYHPTVARAAHVLQLMQQTQS
jgi:tetratricopeptide (TPR) repeat protein